MSASIVPVALVVAAETRGRVCCSPYSAGGYFVLEAGGAPYRCEWSASDVTTRAGSVPSLHRSASDTVRIRFCDEVRLDVVLGESGMAACVTSTIWLLSDYIFAVGLGG